MNKLATFLNSKRTTFVGIGTAIAGVALAKYAPTLPTGAASTLTPEIGGLLADVLIGGSIALVSLGKSLVHPADHQDVVTPRPEEG